MKKIFRIFTGVKSFVKKNPKLVKKTGIIAVCLMVLHIVFTNFNSWLFLELNKNEYITKDLFKYIILGLFILVILLLFGFFSILAYNKKKQHFLEFEKFRKQKKYNGTIAWVLFLSTPVMLFIYRRGLKEISSADSFLSSFIHYFKEIALFVLSNIIAASWSLAMAVGFSKYKFAVILTIIIGTIFMVVFKELSFLINKKIKKPVS